MRKRTEKKTRPSSGSFFFAPEAQNLMRNKKREVKTRNGEEIDEEKISVFLSTCLFYSENVTKRRNFFEKPLTNGKTSETAFEGFQKDFENQREKGRLS